MSGDIRITLYEPDNRKDVKYEIRTYGQVAA